MQNTTAEKPTWYDERVRLDICLVSLVLILQPRFNNREIILHHDNNPFRVRSASI